MRVAIDYTAAVRQVAGVGRHTRSLVGALLELELPQVEFTLFYAAGGLLPQQLTYLYSLEARRPPHVTFVRLPFSEPNLTRFWQKLHAPLPLEWLARLDRPFPFFPDTFGKQDLWHFPDYALPPLRHGKGIVTVHDLSFLITPECAEEGLRRYLTTTVPRSVRRARHVIVVSDNIKQELVNRLNVSPDKIGVVYNGVGTQFQPIADQVVLEDVRRRLNLPPHFVLFVGTIEPRKNLTRLIEAWHAIKQRPEGVDRKLVLAGRRGWLYEPIFRRITDLGLKDEVIWLDFVADSDLPALYNLADLFVFPSLNEGFGIPPLEALACGTPIITANNSALGEVFHDVAVLVDPYRVDKLVDAISAILSSYDSDRQMLVEMRVKGLNHAKRFSWENSAHQTLNIYQQILG